MEYCNPLVCIEDRVSLLVPDRVLSRGVARMQDSDTAAHACWRFSLRLFLLDFFLTLLDLQLIDKLIKLVKAIVLLVNDHLILQHILVVSDPYHSHHQLLSGQRGEFARV